MPSVSWLGLDTIIYNPKLVSKRDNSFYIKGHNVVGTSKGYVERICDSYASVDVKNVSAFIFLYTTFKSNIDLFYKN